ncbi:RPM1-interacting protein 4 isoform X2 [Malania oleifera]|uniref:RPM1-interacting protein 4 isoform X2 n=1 Tax=Malania oleifera TaxID=397392 RepID=UPI0025AE8D96|nr:RPM1-interacting protein 4 isoform X2 [Malania oleifera]
MAQRSHVPKFGNWESEENVPYTAYFEKARVGRSGGKLINPNDPQENPDIFYAPSKTRAEPEELSSEDGDLKQVTGSPARYNRAGLGGYDDSTQHQGGHGLSPGEINRKHPRQSAGSEHGIERSPLHPHYVGRVTGKGSRVSSPSWEGKVSHDASHGTPGRSRMKPVARSDDSLDKGAAVPKFGEWDETNPSSADGYTHIFNKVREERHTGGTKVPGMDSEPSYGKINADESHKSCCFPWCRK